MLRQNQTSDKFQVNKLKTMLFSVESPDSLELIRENALMFAQHTDIFSPEIIRDWYEIASMCEKRLVKKRG